MKRMPVVRKIDRSRKVECFSESFRTPGFALKLIVLLAAGIVFEAGWLSAATPATAVARVTAGFVSSILVIDGGDGYEVAPEIQVEGGGGTGATAIAIMDGDSVITIVVTSAGNGYNEEPDILIGAPPESSLSIGLVPKLTISGSPGTSKVLQWSESLGEGANWHYFTNVVMRTSEEIVVDLFPGAASRYYRLGEAEDLPGFGSEPVSGQPYIIPDLALELEPIPEGSFTMGSPEDEKDRRSDEGPQTSVTISQPFWLAKHEVTQRQYEVIMGNNPSRFLSLDNRRDAAPVDSISWNLAVDFCRRLTEREAAASKVPRGYEYRLPTEAQWEYACRAGTLTRFHYGDDSDYQELFRYAWYAANGENITHLVGGKRANPWRLFDMNGNIWEWCSDWYVRGYSGGNVTDPFGSDIGIARVVRGGSYFDPRPAVRSASRFAFTPDYSAIHVGFRVALAPIPSKAVLIERPLDEPTRN
ncbi:formylglycine-generating enzyme family protein [Verrucomicrobia bacterium]|nr:formylglycine-generating enzyme family protein [Verrucomicrobiota bacterium]